MPVCLTSKGAGEKLHSLSFQPHRDPAGLTAGLIKSNSQSHTELQGGAGSHADYLRGENDQG